MQCCAFWKAYDGNVGTWTYTTNPNAVGVPERSLLTLPHVEGKPHVLSRIRINDIVNNKGNGRLTKIAVKVTTSWYGLNLNARVYSNVANLKIERNPSGISGDSTLPSVRILSGHSYEHLDLLHDGFYSIMFDPVPGATGFELAWETSGTWKHWAVREIEAYGY